MSNATYDIYLYDPYGTKLTSLGAFYTCEYMRAVGSIGTLTIALPDVNFDLFKIDGRIAVYRSIGGGAPYLDGETLWFIRSVSRTLDEQGRAKITVRAQDAVSLLKRRIVAYSAGTSQSKKTDEADDMMKEIVRENFVSATDTARNLDSTLLAVAVNTSQGPSLSKAFARRNVLTVLQELSEAAAVAGTYTVFDVVAVSETKVEFRTYTGQRGVDHRYPSGVNPIPIGAQFGNLANTERTYDHTEEVTYVYAGGQGEGAARDIATATDSTRSGISPFGRIEVFRQATNIDIGNTTALADEADATLREGRPRQIFEGKLLDTPGTIYGIHYGFGDIVTASTGTEVFDCRIDKIHVTLADKKETIDVRLRSVM